MSTDSFNLAPAQTMAAGATTAPAPHTTLAPTAAAAAPAPASRPKKKQTATDDQAGQSVAGVVIPGAALTGLISLCWLIHQFGLPAVLLAVAACAAAATAALVLKARKGTKRVSSARKAAARAAGGGGSGRTVLNRSAGPVKKPRSGGSTGTGGGGRRPGSTTSSGLKASGPTRKTNSSAGGGKRTSSPTRTTPSAVKPAGLVKPKKSPTPVPSRNQPQKTPGTGLLTGLTGARAPKNGGRGKQVPAPRTPKKNTPTTGGKGATRPTTAPRTPARPTSPAPKSGKAGLLTRITGRKTPTPAPGVPGKPAGTLNKKLTGSKASRKLAPTSKAARANTAQKPRTPKPAQLKPKTLKPIPVKKAVKQAAKGKKPKTLKRKPTAHMNRWRRATYLAGVKLRKHTSRKTRRRIRRVISPARTAVRTTGRILSKPLAHTWRRTTRGVLAAHMFLGTIRYTSAGPNWLRPMAAVLHAITSPVARTLAATGSWGWLNRWMYQHTAPHIPKTSPTPTTTPTPKTPPTPAPAAPAHHTITTPVVPKGTPMSASAPIEQAVDAVRQAGAMLLTNPADNMVGYEATLHALATLQAEIGEAVRAAGESTRQNFKVNPAIAEAYDDTAGYANSLAGRLEEIPALFRTLHEEQIDNIENPTVQARKWDISANE